MSFRYEIRLSGEGGQGLVLAGKILAEAAAVYDDLNATQSQSYGPEARGGASRSEIIISDDDIDYPKAMNIDLLLALTQESCDKYSSDLKENGILILDEDAVRELPNKRCRMYKLPIIRIAREEIGRSIVGNLVALGIIAGLTKLVSTESLKAAIESRVPKGTEEINLKAFQAGFDLAKNLN